MVFCIQLTYALSNFLSGCFRSFKWCCSITLDCSIFLDASLQRISRSETSIIFWHNQDVYIKRLSLSHPWFVLSLSLSSFLSSSLSPTQTNWLTNTHAQPHTRTFIYSQMHTQILFIHSLTHTHTHPHAHTHTLFDSFKWDEPLDDLSKLPNSRQMFKICFINIDVES